MSKFFVYKFLLWFDYAVVSNKDRHSLVTLSFILKPHLGSCCDRGEISFRAIQTLGKVGDDVKLLIGRRDHHVATKILLPRK